MASDLNSKVEKILDLILIKESTPLQVSLGQNRLNDLATQTNLKILKITIEKIIQKNSQLGLYDKKQAMDFQANFHKKEEIFRLRGAASLFACLTSKKIKNCFFSLKKISAVSADKQYEAKFEEKLKLKMMESVLNKKQAEPPKALNKEKLGQALNILTNNLLKKEQMSKSFYRWRSTTQAASQALVKSSAELFPPNIPEKLNINNKANIVRAIEKLAGIADTQVKTVENHFQKWRILLEQKKNDTVVNTIKGGFLLDNFIEKKKKKQLRIGVKAILKKKPIRLGAHVLKSITDRNLRAAFEKIKLKSQADKIKKITLKTNTLLLNFNKRLALQKLAGFRKIKEKSASQYVREVKNLTSVFEKIKKNRLYIAFNKFQGKKIKIESTIRSSFVFAIINAMTKIKHRLLKHAFNRVSKQSPRTKMKRCLRIWSSFWKHKLQNAFFLWRSEAHLQKLRKLNVSKKLKAKILVSCSKTIPSLNLRHAFFRWKVRTDKDLVKQAVERFALLAKINMSTVYWRLRTAISDSQPKKMLEFDIKKRKSMALINLTLLFSNTEKKYKRDGLRTLFKWSRTLTKLKLQRFAEKFNSKLQRNILLGFENIRNYTEMLKKIYVSKTLSNLAERINQAHIKNCSVLLQAGLARGNLSRQVMLEKVLRKIVEKNLQESFEAFKDDRKKGLSLKEFATQKFVGAIASRTKISLSKWHDHAFWSNKTEKNLRIMSLFSQMSNHISQVVQINTRELINYNREIEKMKMRAIRMLIKNTTENLQETLQKWKSQANLIRIAKMLNDERFKRIKSYFSSYLEKMEYLSVKRAIEIWRRQASENHLKKKFFSVMYKTTFGRVHRFFRMWRVLPERETLFSQKRANALLNNLTKISIRSYKTAWDPLEEELKKAKNKKLLAIRELMDVTMNRSHKAFYHWSNYTTYCGITEKTMKRIEIIKRLKNNMNDALYRNTKDLLSASNITALKYSVIKRIAANTKQVLLDAIFIWLQNAQRISIKEDLKYETYRGVMERIFRASTDANSRKLARALNTLSINAKKSKSIAFLNSKLIQTANVKMLQLFMRWRGLPAGGKKISCFAAGRLNSSLEGLQRGNKSRIMNVFKKSLDLGRERKDQTVKQIGKSISNKLNRVLLKWRSGSNNGKNVGKLRALTIFFNNLNSVIAGNVKEIIYPSIIDQKKREVVNKLINNLNMKMKQALEKWVRFSNVEKVKEIMTNQIKAKLLERLNGNRRDAQKGLIKEGLEQFKKNASTWKFIQGLHKTLLNTKTAKMYQVFSRWRALPDVRSSRLQNIAATKLEKSLTRMLDNKLKATFDPLKAVHNSGNEAIRRCCLIISLNTTDKTRKYFKEWHNRAVRADAVEKSMSTLKLFENISNVIISNNRNLLRDDSKVNSKENAIKNLIINFKRKQREAFLLWRTHNQIQEYKREIHSEREVRSINKIEITTEYKGNDSLRDIFKKFKQNAEEGKSLKRYYVKILANKQKQMGSLFSKWKGLPTHKGPSDQILKAASGLEQRLSKLLGNSLRNTFTPLKEEVQKGENKKQLACKQISLFAEGLKQGAFAKWKNDCGSQVSMAKLAKTQFFFEILNDTVNKNNKNLFLPDKIDIAREQTVEKMIKNVKSKHREAFIRWRTETKFKQVHELIIDEKKKQALERFNMQAVKNADIHKKDVLSKFYLNNATQSIIKRFKDKMMKSKSGQMNLLFNRWRALPDKKANDLMSRAASQLEKGLTAIAVKKLRSTYEPLKDNLRKGETIQLNSCKEILRKTMSKHQRAFNNWRDTARGLSFLDRIKGVQAIFGKLNDILSQNLYSLLKESETDKKKSEVIRKIFLSGNNKLRHAVQIWARNAHIKAAEEAVKAAQQTSALKTTEDAVKHIKNNLLHNALYRFQQNAKVQKIVKQLHARLMNSKSMHMYLLFNKWKNLPERKGLSMAERAANELERKLSKLVQRSLKKSYDCFKEDLSRGENKMKLACKDIIGKTMSGNKRALLVWGQKARDHKVIEALRLSNSFFFSLNELIRKNNSTILSLQPVDKVTKPEVLKRIFFNYKQRLIDAIRIWRNNKSSKSFEEMINTEYRYRKVERISHTMRYFHSDRLREVLLKFKLNAYKAKYIDPSREKAVQSLFSLIDVIHQKNVKQLLARGGFEKNKDQILAKLIRNCRTKTLEAWQRWNSSVGQQRVHKALEKEVKSSAVKTFETTSEHKGKDHIKEALKLFEENAKIGRLIKSLYKNLLNSSTGKMLTVFKKWKNLPDSKANDLLSRAANDLERNLAKLAAQRLKSVFDPLKEIKMKGDNMKLYVCRQITEKTMSGQKKDFLSWKNFVRTRRIIERCQAVNSFFENTQQALNKNIKHLLTDPNKELVKKIILKLIAASNQKLLNAWNIWDKKAKLISAQEDVIAEGKRTQIFLVQKAAILGSKYNLSRVLEQFNKNAQAQRIIKDLHKKLLSTGAGRVQTLFNKWRALPDTKARDLVGKAANDLERKLSKLASQALKSAYDPMKNDYFRGVSLQKQACKEIINKTMSLPKRCLLHWRGVMKSDRDLMVFRKTSALFNTLNNCIAKNNMDLVKKDAFEWQEEADIQIRFEKRTKKVIQIENRAVNNNNNKVRDVLKAFERNARTGRIVRNLYNNLLKTSAGKALTLFRKWKALPEGKNNYAVGQAVNELERKLAKITAKKIKSTFDPLKAELIRGESIQKRVARILINKTMSSQKRSWYHWSHIAKSARLINVLAHTTRFFEIVSEAQSNNLRPLLLKSEFDAKKLSVVRKMVSCRREKILHAIGLWKANVHAYEVEETYETTVKTKTITSIEVLRGKKDLADVLAKFRMNSKVVGLLSRLHTQLLGTGTGKMASLFNRWKSLPSRKGEDMLGRAANGLERQFSKIILKSFKTTFDVWKDIDYEARNKKKQAVRDIIKKTMSSQQIMWNHWASIVKSERTLSVCRRTIDFFSRLQVLIADNNKALLNQGRYDSKKDVALANMIRNLRAKMHLAYKLWRESANTGQVETILRKEIRTRKAYTINNTFDNKRKGELSEALRTFNKNAKINGFIKSIYMKLMGSGTGKMLLLFNRWKALPDLKAQDLAGRAANDLERKLAKLAQKALKGPFDNMKNEMFRGENIQKAACKSIIYKTSGAQRRLWNIWVNYVRNQRMIELCQKTNGFFETTTKVLTNQMNPLLRENNYDVKRKKILLTWLRAANSKKRECFERWRTMNKLTKLADELDQNNKANSIGSINILAIKKRNLDLSRALAIFYRNAKCQQYTKALYKKMIQTKLGMMLRVFNKWRGLPERQSEDLVGRAANDLERKLGKLAQRALKSSFDPMKENLFNGENIQKQACRQLINKTMGAQKRMYLHWYNVMKAGKIIMTCQKTAHVFDVINDLIANNAQRLLAPSESDFIKKKYIIALIHRQENLLRNALKDWLKNAKLRTLAKRLKEEIQTHAIEKSEEQVKEARVSLIKNALRQLHTNAKLSSITKRVHERLLSTTHGKMILLFNRWKALPENRRKDLLGKAMNNLERKLSKLAMNSLKSGYDPLIDEYLRGQGVQKQACKEIINKTMSKQKKMWIHWHQYSLAQKTVQICSGASNFFDTLNGFVTNNNKFLIYDTVRSRKAALLRQLMRSLNSKLRSAFEKWRDNSNKEQLEEAYSLRIKRHFIESFERNVLGNDNKQLSAAFKQFEKNAKFQKFIASIYNKLLGTTSGKMLLLFNRWKALPEKKGTNLAEIALTELERQLAKNVLRHLKSTFDPLKELHYKGENILKSTCRAIISKTTSKQRTAFDHWRQANRDYKLIRTLKLTNKFFDNLNSIAANNSRILLQEGDSDKKKSKILLRILNHQDSKLRDCLNLWKKFVDVSKLKDNWMTERKSRMIETANRSAANKDTEKLKEVLETFNANSKKQKLIKGIYFKLMNSASGRVLRLFNNWKALPNRKKNDDLIGRAANELEKNLAIIVFKGLKSAFEPLKAQKFKAENIEKQVCKEIINKTMSAQRRMFLHWVNIVKSYQTIQICKKANNVFDILNNSIRNNNKVLFSDNISMKRQLMLKLLIKNLRSKLNEGFLKWKNFTDKGIIESNLQTYIKRQFIEVFDRKAHRNDNKNLADALRKFAENAKMQKFIESIYKKLLGSTSGKMFLLFNRWKALPEKKGASLSEIALTELERKLAKNVQRHLKATFDPLKENTYKAENIIKSTCRVIINKTTSSQRSYFDHWRQANRDMKAIRIFKSCTKFFDTLSNVIHANNRMLLTQDEADQKRARAITKILSQRKNKLHDSLILWRKYVEMTSLKDNWINERKARMIEKTNRSAAGKENESLRKVLEAFKANSSRQILIKGIYFKLMNTGSGKVLRLFNNWKALPNRKNNDDLLGRAANELEKKLALLVFKRLKSVNDPLKAQKLEGEMIQKHVCKEIINKTMSAQKRAFLHWHHIASSFRTIKMCSDTVSFFDKLNNIMSKNNKYFMIDNMGLKKRHILDKLVASLKAKQREGFNRWANCSAAKTTESHFMRRIQRQIVETFERKSEKNNNKLLSEALRKFSQNARLQKFISSIYQKLLGTTSGKMLLLFNRWKALPEKKGSSLSEIALTELERKLAKNVQRHLKATFDPLKENTYKAENIIKSTCRVIINKTTSSQRSYFDHWRQANRDMKAIRIFKSCTKFFDTLSNVIHANNRMLLTQDEADQKRVRAITKILSQRKNKLHDSLILWRKYVEMTSLKDNWINERKARMIEKTNRSAAGKENESLRKVLEAFKANSSRQILIKGIYFKLMNTGSGKVLRLFNNWKALPNRKTNDDLLGRAANELEKKLALLVFKRLKSVNDPLKAQKLEGEMIQKHVCKEIINKTMSAQKRAFLHWHHIASSFRTIKMCSDTVSFFDKLNDVFSNNTKALLLDDIQLRKRHVLKTLLNSLKSKKRDSFKLWKSLVETNQTETKYMRRIKRHILETFERKKKNNNNKLTSEVLRKFAQNARIQKFISSIYQKLLGSSSGKMLLLFNRWKALPEKKGTSLSEIALTELERRLAKNVQRHLKSTFDPLKENKYKADNIIKSTCRVIINKTTSSQRSYFDHWRQANRDAKAVKIFQLTQNFFETLDDTISNNNRSVLVQNTMDQKRIKILQMLLNNHTSMLSKYLTTWKKNGQIANLEKNYLREKKGRLIEKANRSASNKDGEKLRNCLAQFRTNAKIGSIVKTLHRKLLGSGSGRMLLLFNKWKNLPDKRGTDLVSRAANDLERKLAKIVQRRLKSSWEPILDQNMSAEAKKKHACREMIKKTASGQRKAWNQWVNTVRFIKAIEICRKTTGFFDEMNDVVGNNNKIILRENAYDSLRRRYLSRLLTSSERKLRMAIEKWRNQARWIMLHTNAQTEIQINSLTVIERFANKNEDNTLAQVLSKFRCNANTGRHLKSVYMKLLGGTSGKMLRLFNKWKNLPERQSDDLVGRAASSLEKHLARLVSHSLKSSFDPMKSNLFKGESIQRHACKQIINKTMGAQKRMWLHWANVTKSTRMIQICNKTTVFFERLNEAIANNNSLLLKSSEFDQVRRKAILKMLRMREDGMRDAFKTWKMTLHSETIRDQLLQEKMKNALRTMDISSMRNWKELQKNAIYKFKTNQSIGSLTKGLYLRLLGGSTGKMLLLFNRWKALPEKKGEDLAGRAANDLERNLAKIVQKALRSTFNPMKEQSYKAENTRKTVIRDLINRTMSTQRRMWIHWKSVVNTTKALEFSKKSARFFEILNDRLALNASQLLLKGEFDNKKRRAIKRLIQNQKENEREALKLWRDALMRNSYQDQIILQKTIRSIELTQMFLNGKEKSLLSNVLEKFNKNARIAQIISNVHKKLLGTTSGKMLKLFNKWKQLPERESEDLAGRAANDLERKLAKIAQKFLKSSFDPLKQQIFKGENIQKQACKQILAKTMGASKRMWLHWVNLTKMNKSIQICIKSQRFFEKLNDVLRANATPLMTHSAFDEKKLDVVRRLVNNQQNLQKKSLHLWSSRTKLKSVTDVMSTYMKRTIVQRFEQIEGGNNHGALKLVLGHFYKNARLQSLVKRVYNRLLGTGSGKMLLLFNRWKVLPDVRSKTLIGRAATQLESNLGKLAYRALKSCYDPMKMCKQAGENKQKIACREILLKTVGAQKRMWIKWNHYVTTEKTLETCRRTEAFMSTLNNAISVNNSLILQDAKHAKQQIGRKWAIRMIINKNLGILKRAWDKWNKSKDQINHEREAALLNAKRMVERTDNAAQANNVKALKDCLEKFDKNRKINKLIKTVHERLLQSGSGKMLLLFNKWKNLPERKPESLVGKAANDLERQFSKIVQRTLKSSFDPLKEEHYKAESLQKQACKKLIAMTMSESKRAFDHWKNSMRISKVVESCRAVSQFFERVNNVVSQNNNSILVSDAIDYKRIHYLKMIVHNKLMREKDAFSRWRMVATFLSLQQTADERAQVSAIENMERASLNNHHAKLREALSIFNRNTKTQRYIKQLYKTLMGSSAGRMFRVYQKWKALPERKGLDLASAAANDLERKLSKLLQKKLKSSFQPMCDINTMAQSKQRMICKTLINRTMSNQKRMFLHWISIVRTEKDLLIFRKTAGFFEEINRRVTDNNSPILTRNDIERKKEKFIQMLVDRGMAKMGSAFDKWKQKGEIKHLQNRLEAEKKGGRVILMNRALDKNLRKPAAEALVTFLRNARIGQMIQNLYNKLQGTTSGRMLRLFNKWKNLPDTKAKDLVSQAANSLERNLAKIAVKKLKSSFDPLKDQLTDGQNKQKRVIRELIIKTMNGQKRTFLKWAGYTKNQRLLAVCNKTHSFFSVLENIIHNNNHMILASTGKFLTKEKVLQTLFKNMGNKYKESFDKWKDATLNKNVGKLLVRINRQKFPMEKEVRSAAVHTAASEVIKLQSRSLEANLNNLWRYNLKFAFQRIKHAADIDLVKTYCNSIWKWKLSNVEARCYSERNRDVKRAYYISRFVNALSKLNNMMKRDAFSEISKKLRIDQGLRKLRNYNRKVCKHYLGRWRIFTEQDISEDWRQNFIYACMGSRILRLLSKKEEKEKTISFFKWKQERGSKSRKISALKKVMRLVEKQKVVAFMKMKSLVFDQNKRLESVMKLIQNRFKEQMQSSFVCIKQKGLERKRLRLLFGLLNELATRNVKGGAFKHWINKAKERDPREIERIKRLIPIIMKKKSKLLQNAWNSWAQKEKSAKLANLVKILEQRLKAMERHGFNKIVNRNDMLVQFSKLKGIYKILILNKTFEKMKLMSYFEHWKTNGPMLQNPWFKRATHILAKNSALNFQIAFWRLRDNMTLSGVQLSAPKIVKCKKMFNNIRKLYELVMAKAFWTIERYGTVERSSMEKSVKETTRPKAISKHLSQIEFELRGKDTAKHLASINSVKRILLKNILKRIRKTMRNAFLRWALKCSIADKKAINNVKNTLDPFEMNYVSRIGAAQHLGTTLEKILMKNSIRNVGHMFSQLGKVNQKINDNYELDRAYDVINKMSVRINLMITHKFVRMMEKYRTLLIQEAFIQIKRMYFSGRFERLSQK